MVGAFIRFFLPTFLINLFWSTNFVKYGFSIVCFNGKSLGNKLFVGHLNFIKVDKIQMGSDARIDNLNFIRGNFDLIMDENSLIHNQNKITCIGTRYRDIALHLKRNARINVGHLLDLTGNITIGQNSMLTGSSTQIWTHGFYFRTNGDLDVRVDKDVIIGDYVNIGSRCCICPGVSISDKIMIGSQTTVAKNLTDSGLYVGQSLRYVEFDPNVPLEQISEEHHKINNIYVVNKSSK